MTTMHGMIIVDFSVVIMMMMIWGWGLDFGRRGTTNAPRLLGPCDLCRGVTVERTTAIVIIAVIIKGLTALNGWNAVKGMGATHGGCRGRLDTGRSGEMQDRTYLWFKGVQKDNATSRSRTCSLFGAYKGIGTDNGAITRRGAAVRRFYIVMFVNVVLVFSSLFGCCWSG